MLPTTEQPNKACLNCRARRTNRDAVKPICLSCKHLGPKQQSQCKYGQPAEWLESIVCPNRTQQNQILELELKLESLERTLAQLSTLAAIKHEQQYNPSPHHFTGITTLCKPQKLIELAEAAVLRCQYYVSALIGLNLRPASAHESTFSA
ncbi:hypothetical protein PtA15_1A395 [Puccinia triticina]|uniref:Zn(2)-C6 fungal-type domain-containing protein n=1 Tax=Puccinia triticina TaxID=208348 RepID=A0ABY7CDZ9_9BASI|nr:uncharacterized protein PtA15_1A395 [Puccinia triticina]WAQ81057.1 hypothetical protein PtA15_1A395 [Puccinia triticina]